ncbi:MAG: heavy metal-responsive transcriptional regulator [Cellulomonas sp. 73-145]|uniref:heavy metal-responsive transcriptional regulator n=1 Tax=Cellulomonas sp. 73-145 TaxID=1895739 RepID=UPI00092CA5FF|nr:heavy metal-responsive transcriptional regulator [Cellulomonas sp. 73-145]MBN9326755.1 heavy metal-responsive transcriptional regulator [Cellulomonas sp.]OJV57462.1 MAG: heavy metal-responsive transcriptional regulator [Cellulomonas sp. 73-145]
MLIGELAQQTGLTSQTIRFYERQGLLHPAARGANGYRSYDDSAAARIRFVRAGQAAGLSLVQIRGIVDLREHGQAPCTHVARLVEDELVEVRRRIADLEVLQTELEQLRERSRRLDPADCTDIEVCHILAGHD